MSINNDRPSPSRPSLLGAAQTSTVPPPDSSRVLAQLEGRKPSPPFSSNAKAIGAGALAAVLMGTGGFWAWQSRGIEVSTSAPSDTPTSLAVQVASKPDTLLASSSDPAHPVQAAPEPDMLPAPPSEPAQAARILDAAPITGTTPAASKAGPTTHSLSSAARPAPKQAASGQSRPKSGASRKPVTLQASTAPAKSHARKTKASQAVHPSQASARRVPSAKQQSQRPAKPDPDAELLTTLLQRKDPREASTQK